MLINIPYPRPADLMASLTGGQEFSRPADLMASLTGGQEFSKIDLTSAHQHMILEE